MNVPNMESSLLTDANMLKNMGWMNNPLLTLVTSAKKPIPSLSEGCNMLAEWLLQASGYVIRFQADVNTLSIVE
jgi:hypothetical protein